MTGGTDFTSQLLTEQPMNVSHTCSQTCLFGLQHDPFPLLSFPSFPSLPRHNLAQATRGTVATMMQERNNPWMKQQALNSLSSRCKSRKCSLMSKFSYLIHDCCSHRTHAAQRYALQNAFGGSLSSSAPKQALFLGREEGSGEVLVWLGWEIPVGLRKTAQALGMEPCPRLLC